MSKAFAPPTDERVGYVITGRSVISNLTGIKYPFSNNQKSKNDAIEKLKEQDTQALRAADERLGNHLGRLPTLKEIKRHFEHGDVLQVDTRPLRQRVLEDGEFRSNTEKSEDDFGGAPLRRGDLDNQTLWGKSKARREIAEQLKQRADAADEQRQQELQEQAAKEARENDPMWVNACQHSEVTQRLARVNPGTTESELTALRARHDALHDGRLDINAYWREVEKSDHADSHKPDSHQNTKEQ